MSEFDYLDLDGHLLRLLVTVVEEGSVTGAADRLGVTQSAVSHLLDKLRRIVGDPLFVKAGRGIVPTAQALALVAPARSLIDEFRRFGTPLNLDPQRLRLTLTVAANDLQRDLLLPGFVRRLRAAAPQIRLRVISSGAPTSEMLRSDACQLLITPRPPEAGDIKQKRLFDDDYRVFYDPTQRAAPADLADYLAAEHVTVVYESGRRLSIDDDIRRRGMDRRFALEVPDFASIGAFLREMPALATLPGLLRVHLLRGLASVPLPFEVPRMPMYLLWHLRHHEDPAFRWLRQQLEGAAHDAIAGLHAR